MRYNESMAMKIHRNIKIAALMILIVLTATGIDWMAHQTSHAFDVPSDYFRNKIIYGVLWGLLGLFVLRKMNDAGRKAFWISACIAVILQTRYFLLGYDHYFVFLFIFIHFAAFFLPMLIVFRNFPELFSGWPYSK